uniref:Uncharacterized protein n=1 Tax=Romanomermis culicivorax TaxID=13658 RepID=A0A915IJZ2_ROMCU
MTVDGTFFDKTGLSCRGFFVRNGSALIVGGASGSGGFAVGNGIAAGCMTSGVVVHRPRTVQSPACETQTSASDTQPFACSRPPVRRSYPQVFIRGQGPLKKGELAGKCPDGAEQGEHTCSDSFQAEKTDGQGIRKLCKNTGEQKGTVSKDEFTVQQVAGFWSWEDLKCIGPGMRQL